MIKDVLHYTGMIEKLKKTIVEESKKSDRRSAAIVAISKANLASFEHRLNVLLSVVDL